MARKCDKPSRNELARVLNEHAVDYVVVGGIAAIRHGSRRATFDLDIVPEPNRANYERLATALEAIEALLRGVDAHLLDLDPRDLKTLAGGADLGLATDLGILDVLQDLVAVDYAQLRSRAEPARLGDQEIHVAHVDDLIAMKLRAGRLTCRTSRPSPATRSATCRPLRDRRS
jgi:hypothetical protein